MAVTDNGKFAVSHVHLTYMLMMVSIVYICSSHTRIYHLRVWAQRQGQDAGTSNPQEAHATVNARTFTFALEQPYMH